MRKRRGRAQPGSAYLAIVGATMLVAVIGFAAVTAARVQLRVSERSGDVLAARSLARSAVQIARVYMDREPDWRRARPNGVWVERQPLDGGAITIEVIDPTDNDLANWDSDPVEVTATGFAGGATQTERVTLVAQRPPLGCLEVAALADGAYAVNNGTITCDQTLATNANFTSSGASAIDSRVEAGGLISGSGYLGTRASDVPRRSTPEDQVVFDAYLANATWINYSSLAAGGVMEGVVLSPNNNPYGPATNAQGVYAIDCASRPFVLRDARVVGTLVLVNAAADARVEGAVHVAPAVPNYPCLLVRGPMRFAFGGAALAETAGRNFNPPGTPYNGSSNNTTVDTYPSRVEGLVYVAGAAALDFRGRFHGVLASDGSIAATGTLTISYMPGYASSPPPAFSQGVRMTPVAGSAARVVK